MNENFSGIDGTVACLTKRAFYGEHQVGQEYSVICFENDGILLLLTPASAILGN